MAVYVLNRFKIVYNINYNQEIAYFARKVITYLIAKILLAKVVWEYSIKYMSKM